MSVHCGASGGLLSDDLVRDERAYCPLCGAWVPAAPVVHGTQLANRIAAHAPDHEKADQVVAAPGPPLAPLGHERGAAGPAGAIGPRPAPVPDEAAGARRDVAVDTAEVPVVGVLPPPRLQPPFEGRPKHRRGPR